METNIDSPVENSEDKSFYLALNKIADHLARRDHSEKELREKLSRHFTKDVINQAIERAYQDAWMPEPQELAQKVTESLHQKHKGWLYIIQYLKKKGLPLVDRNEERELQKASDWLEARHSRQDLEKQEHKHKAYRQLKSRGFEDSVIYNVL